MSGFLGPIHFWVYNKIQVQQSPVEEHENILRMLELVRKASYWVLLGEKIPCR